MSSRSFSIHFNIDFRSYANAPFYPLLGDGSEATLPRCIARGFAVLLGGHWCNISRSSSVAWYGSSPPPYCKAGFDNRRSCRGLPLLLSELGRINGECAALPPARMRRGRCHLPLDHLEEVSTMKSTGGGGVQIFTAQRFGSSVTPEL